MTVKELIEKLSKFEPDQTVILAVKTDGVATIDDLKSVNRNGSSAQLTGESIYEDS